MTTETMQYLVTANYEQLAGLSAEVDNVNRKLSRDTYASAARGRSAFNALGRRAGYLALGIAALSGASFKSAADFESAMNVFQVTSDATARQMKAAGKEAIALGADARLPGISARDAADAMNELAKGGFTATGSMKAARSVLVLGHAANIDLADSATIVARSLKAFGLPAKQAYQVVDAIAAASIKSTVGIREIADGMQYASAPAHVLGVNFKDTATSLAILNDRGIVGSQAGAALGMMLTKLATPTKAASEEMKKLGLTTADGNSKFFDARGNFVGMQKATELYTGATKNLTQEEKLHAAWQIFGIRGQRAAIQLLGGGVKTWDQYRAAVGKTGMAQKILNAQTKGARGAIEAASSAWDTFKIVLGGAVAPAVTALLRGLTKVFQFLMRFPTATAVALGVLGTLAATIWALVAATKAARAIQDMAKFMKLAERAAKAWTAVQTVLNAELFATEIVLGITVGEVLIAIAIVVALGVAFYELYQHCETFRNGVNLIWHALQDAFGWIKANWPLVAGILLGPFAVLIGLATNAFGFRDKFIAAFQGILDFLSGFGAMLWNAIKGPLEALGGFLERYWKYILVGVLTALLGPLGLVLGLIVATIATHFQAIVNFLRPIWNTIRNIVVTGANAVKTAITSTWNALVSVVTGIWNRVVSGFRTAFNAAVAVARAVVNAVRAAILGVWNAAPSWMTGPASRMVSNMAAAIRRGVGLARAGVSAIKSAIVGFFAGAGGWLLAAGAAIVHGLASGITGAIGSAVSAASKLVGAVKGAIGGVKGFIFGSPSKWAIEVGYSIGDGLSIGMTGSVPKAEAAAANLAKRTINKLLATVKASSGQLQSMLEFAFGQMQSGQDTAAGAQLKALQEQHAEQQRQQALADAQAQLAAATTDEERKAAQQQVADAQYEIQVAALQKESDAQQAAFDWQQQQQKAAFDKAITNLNNYLASAHATAAGARKRINAIMKNFGIDIAQMGELIGPEFASSVEKQIPRVVAAAVKLARAVTRALDKEWHSSPWFTYTMGQTLTKELARGLESKADIVGQKLGGLTALQPTAPASVVVNAPSPVPAVSIDTVNVATDLDLQRLSATLSTAVALRR